MFTRICRALLAAAVLTLPIYAADQPWNGAPFAADPKALLAAAESVPAGDSAVVVLLDEKRYTFDAEGHSTRTSRLVFRIVDQSAVAHWSTVEAEWAPWSEEKPVIAARVISKSGAVNPLDAKAVTEAPARDESLDIFSDNRIVRAPLPAVAAGSVVEQVITWKDRNPLLDTGTSGRMQFGRYAPVQQSRLVIDAPSSTAIRVVNKTAPHIEPRKEEKDGRQQIVFELGRLEALEDLEWNLPYDESPVPFVAFSTGKSWQELARRYNEIVEKQIAAGSVSAFAKETVGASTDPKEIAAKALAAIEKNVRYAGVEVGEGSIVPRAPQQVIALKYGDCKDKATLLVAMLRAAGLDADVGLLRAGTELDVHPDLPSLSEFNHAIVHVSGAQPMWIDPTDEYSPAGRLSTQDQDRLVLIASPSTTALVRTPAGDSNDNRTLETRLFNLSDEGKAEVVETTESTGADDASQRRFCAETDKKHYREAMEKYATAEYAGEKLKSLDNTDPRDLSKPFRLTLTVSEAARGTTGDIDAAAALFQQHLLNMLPYALRKAADDDDEKENSSKKPKKRTRDFVFTNPYVKEWRYRVVPPPGFVARTLPPNETKQIGTMSLATQYAIEPDGAVTATLHFDSGKRRITAAEYDETRKAVAAVLKTPATILGFDSVGWTKLNAGDVGGALAEFRRLAELHPKEARHHVQIARAYLAGGMGEAARNEIQRAIAMEPKYAPAHRIRGYILQHDLLGREFRKGFDLSGAIAEYKKAKELDSKDENTRGELAKLLEHGDDGILFGHNAHLDEAIAEYESLIKDLKSDGYEDEVVSAMVHARKFAELKSRSRDIKDTQQRMLAMVLAAAATDGVEAALREAKSADPNARRQILANSVQTLMQLRLYPQAAAMLEESVQGMSNASEARPVLEALRHAKRMEEMKLDPNDPKSLVIKLVTLVMTEEIDDEKIEKFAAPFLIDFEKELKAKGKTPKHATKANVFSAIRTMRSQMDMPIEVIADLGMAFMDFQQEGNDATGYRLRMRAKPGLPNSTPTETFYIVRDKDHYTLAGVRSDPSGIGIAALHFIQKNDLDTARQWLNWAREDIAARGGDDPLASPPFAALWPKAKATATPDEIRTAAAVLLTADNDLASASSSLLAEVREKTKEDQRKWVDLALAAAYGQLDEVEHQIVVARRLLAAHPDSETAFMILATALIEHGDAAEVQKLAKERLDKSAKDEAALRALSQLASNSGDFEASSKYLRQVIEGSNATSIDYNNVAWNELFIGKTIDKAIEDARQATTLTEDASSELHTLAALYAESGKSLEARTELFKSMDQAGHEEPSSVDWYVLGRIAENFGAADVAVADYKRVEKPDRHVRGSTYELAQRRLTALAKK